MGYLTIAIMVTVHGMCHQSFENQSIFGKNTGNDKMERLSHGSVKTALK